MPFDPNDPDTKAALKAAVDEAVSEMTADIDAIKKNRDQLLKEKKELQRSATITPEQLAAVEAERDKAITDLTAAQKAAKDATTAKEKAEKALEQESGFTQKLLIQDGLKSELIKNGVKDEDFIDTLTAKFASTAAVVAEGDNRKVMLGEKSLADAIKEFAESDSGKKFVSAPNNSGGGAGGGSGEGGGKTMTRAQFDALDGVAKVAFAKEGGKVVDQAA